MTFPVQGQKYTVQTGDTLTGIALTAYGNAVYWRILWNGNQSVLRSGNPDLIYPGEVISIPVDSFRAQALQNATESTLKTKPQYSMTVNMGGLQIPMMSGRLKRSIDTMVDQFTGEIPWVPGQDANLDAATAPFSYTAATVYLGSTLSLTGRMYDSEHDKSTGGSTKILECYSTTVDLVDSTMPAPYFRDAQTMQQLAQAVTAGFGVGVSFPSGVGANFTYGIEGKTTETAGKFLQRIAFQSGMVAGNDEKGNMVFQTAKLLACQPSVGTLNESEPWGQKLHVKFRGRERYGIYKAIGWEGDGAPVKEFVKDPVVPNTRIMTFVVDDNDPGNARITAAWKASKQLIEALTIPIPLTGWYAPNGALWAPGQMVTVKSPTLGCPNGFAFLIKDTEHIMDGAGGFTCNLSLIPPQALTGEKLNEPWVVK